MPLSKPDTRSIPWVRSPRQLDFFAGWTPGEVKLWTAINSATQINTRQGRVSVPQLARYTGYSERSIYRILRRLKDRVALYALISPGQTACYYLPLQYAAKPLTPTTTYTRDTSVTGHNKERIDNNTTPQRRPYSRYRAYGVPPLSPELRATCYQSYNEYLATTNCPVSIYTWVAG